MHKADKRFLVEFSYAGSDWSIEIWADDWQDAERKLLALKTNARLLGEAVMQIKIPGPMERFIGWLTRGARP